MDEGATRGAYWTDSTAAAAGGGSFWFVRPFLRMGLPAWGGAFVLTAIAFGGFTLLDWVAVDSLVSYESLGFVFHLVFFALTAILIGRETERMLAYAESIGAGGTERMRRTLYSTTWAFVMAVPLEAIYLGPLLMAPGFTLADLFRNAAFLGVFHILVGASAVWAFASSMKALYDLGHAPLSLKPFTEDRSLGLRPFGTAALRLVTIYEVAVLVGALPMITGARYDPLEVFTFAGLAFVGIVLFFLPLLSFRRQMREAKARELEWIGPRYAELVAAVRTSRGAHVDEEIVGSLSVLDKIQRDVQQIHSWPFDEAIAARLVSITVLPLVIAVLARETMVLALHV